MEDQNVQAENSNQAEEVVLETTEVESTQEDSTDWKAVALKKEELANNYKVRAEKAEKLAKQVQPQKVEVVKPEISTTDVIALIKANIPEDDIDDVKDYAKFKGISIAEAIKTPTIKSLLSEKAEARQTANATNVSNARRSPAKVSGETLLHKAQKGEMPDENDLTELIKARRGMK